MQLAHISAVCSTSENAKRFYAGLLHLKKIKEFTLDAKIIEQIFGKKVSCQIMLFGSNQFTVEVFIQEEGLAPANPFVHHCLEVPEKDLFLERCKREGLVVNYIAKGDKILTFIRDFDENLYEIK